MQSLLHEPGLFKWIYWPKKATVSTPNPQTTPLCLKSPIIRQIILNHRLDLLRVANHWLFFLPSFHSSDCSIWKCLAPASPPFFLFLQHGTISSDGRTDLRFSEGLRFLPVCRGWSEWWRTEASKIHLSVQSYLYKLAWLSLCSTAGEFSFQIWDLIQIYQSEKTIPSQRRKSAVHTKG